MSQQPAATLDLTSSASAEAANLRARAVFDQQLWTLGRLAQAGLNLALALEAQALAPQPHLTRDQGPQPYGAPAAPSVSLDNLPPAPADLALAFTRISRAVRMTVALQARLLKSGDGGERAMATKAPAPPPPERRSQRANRIAAVVRRLVAQGEDDIFEASDLVERARERLFDPDITGALLDRPFDAVVAEICRDLGLSPDWSALGTEAWAMAALSGAAGGDNNDDSMSGRRRGAPGPLDQSPAFHRSPAERPPHPSG
jgi:hypothetical protein